MTFPAKASIRYRVMGLDVWGDEGEWTVNDRRELGRVSVRASKSGSVEKAALVRALVEGHYLKQGVTPRDVEVDGEDDGVLNIDAAEDGYPVLQLEYEDEREQPSKGLLGEPGAARENPAPGGLPTWQLVGLAGLGTLVVVGVGYWLFKGSQPAGQLGQGGSQVPYPAAQPTGPQAVASNDSSGTDAEPPFTPGF
jgi:hypothetical protein